MKSSLNITFYKEEKFKETPIGKIPEDWEVVRLGSNKVSVLIKSGSTPSKKVKDYWNGNIPFVTQSDMTKVERYLYNTSEKITELGLKSSNLLLVPENSILLSMYGTIGKVVINKVPVAVSQNIAAIIPNRKEVDEEYLYYTLQKYSSQFKRRAKIITLKHLDIKIVKSTLVPLPPLEEQKAIAYILSTVDEALQKTNEIIEKTERLKKGLMQELLTKGMTLGFMFDTNIFDKILDGKVELPKGLPYYVTHIQYDEILNMPESKRERREKLIKTFRKVPKEIIPTEGAVVGVSRVDMAKLMAKDDAELFHKMLKRLKELDERAGKTKSLENRVRDILIALTCLKNCLTLITNDKNLKKLAQEFQCPAITFEQFLRGIRREFKDTEIGKIPKEWKVVKLKDVILEIKKGFACGKRDENGILQLRMDNIDPEGWINTNAGVKVPIPKNVDDYILRPGDILFNNTNSVDLIGKTAIFRGEFRKCVYSNHITRIRVNPSIVLPEWILYTFIRKWHLGFFKAICHRHVHQAGINDNDLLNIRISLPSLDEQNEIIKILSTVDKKLKIEKKRKEKLERIKKAFMDLLLTGKIRVRCTDEKQ